MSLGEKIYTVSEFAALWGWSEESVRQMCREQIDPRTAITYKLPKGWRAWKTGRDWEISRTEIGQSERNTELMAIANHMAGLWLKSAVNQWESLGTVFGGDDLHPFHRVTLLWSDLEDYVCGKSNPSYHDPRLDNRLALFKAKFGDDWLTKSDLVNKYMKEHPQEFLRTVPNFAKLQRPEELFAAVQAAYQFAVINVSDVEIRLSFKGTGEWQVELAKPNNEPLFLEAMHYKKRFSMFIERWVQEIFDKKTKGNRSASKEDNTAIEISSRCLKCGKELPEMGLTQKTRKDIGYCPVGTCQNSQTKWIGECAEKDSPNLRSSVIAQLKKLAKKNAQ